MKNNSVVGEAHPISAKQGIELEEKIFNILKTTKHWVEQTEKIVSLFQEYAAKVEPASSIEDKSAGVWVKASERLPDKKGYYITRRPTLVGNRWLIKEATFNPKYDDTYIHQWKNLDIEWLDESKQPSSISEEDALQEEWDGEPVETEYELLLMLKNALNEAEELPFGEKVKRNQEILKTISIKRKVSGEEDKIKVISAKVKGHTLIAEVEVEDWKKDLQSLLPNERNDEGS